MNPSKLRKLRVYGYVGIRNPDFILSDCKISSGALALCDYMTQDAKRTENLYNEHARGLRRAIARRIENCTLNMHVTNMHILADRHNKVNHIFALYFHYLTKRYR
jgi:hypothetical protein